MRYWYPRFILHPHFLIRVLSSIRIFSSAFYPPSAFSHPRFILHPHFLIRVFFSIRIFSSAFYPPGILCALHLKNLVCAMAALLSICALLLTLKILQPVDSSMQAVFRRKEQTYFANHVIATTQAETELECGLHCVADGSCLSLNYKISGVNKGRCELNNRTLQETSEGSQETTSEFNYLYVVEKVRNYY